MIQSILKPENVVDAFTDEVESPPLYRGPLTLDEVKGKAKSLYEQLNPSTNEECALFYFLFLSKGHFFPNSNGRIARVIAGYFLEYEPKHLKRLINKNGGLEIREWLQKKNDSLNTNGDLRFTEMYQEMADDIDAFSRIIRGQHPKWLEDFKPRRRR